jgi:NTE family protein
MINKSHSDVAFVFLYAVPSVRMRYLLTFIFTIGVLPLCAQRYTNLVLEGGGIRGVAYVGALKTLQEQNLMQGIKQIAGTSVGSIVAGMVAVGYTADEMKHIMNELKLQKFNDGRSFFIGGTHRMKTNYGWYRGEKIERWIGELIKDKTGNAELTLG